MTRDIHVSRRETLRALLAGAAGLSVSPGVLSALGAAGTTEMRNGSRERPWPRPNRETNAAGAYAPRPQIGLQLYTVRSLMQRDMDGTLAAVAAAGVREVEFAGYFNRTPAQVRDMLGQHGLRSPAVHVGAPAQLADWDVHFEAASTIGQQWVVVPWVGNAVRVSLDTWRTFADQLNAAGARARSYGLRMAYHNHDFEFAVTDGQVAWDVFVDALDPSLVEIELDLYWAVKAGQDPAAMFARWPGRFPLWHLKDAGPAPERTMRDVGAGTIDFAALFAMGSEAGLRHAFIEHDNPVEPLASVRASADALHKLP